jgi:hypothetical protein
LQGNKSQVPKRCNFCTPPHFIKTNIDTGVGRRARLGHHGSKTRAAHAEIVIRNRGDVFKVTGTATAAATKFFADYICAWMADNGLKLETMSDRCVREMTRLWMNVVVELFVKIIIRNVKDVRETQRVSR